MMLLNLKMNRRSFLGTAARLATLYGMQSTAISAIAEALDSATSGGAPVLWLQGQSCSGCSISLLDTYPRSIVQFLTHDIQLKFHQTLSAATGHVATTSVKEVIAKGGYYLVVEGSVPVGMPAACRFDHAYFTDQLRQAIPPAKAVISVGTCSSHGGIPAAEGNPTGAISLRAFMKQEKIEKPCIAVPGCPPHPDWMVGTIAHVIKFGLPPMDADGCPLMFYRRTIHDVCPRFPDYERKNFAKQFGEEGCLFKLGCQGPVTYADCTLRKWNGGTNDCIAAGGCCTGCTTRDYPRPKNFPMYYEVGGHSSQSVQS